MIDAWLEPDDDFDYCDYSAEENYAKKVHDSQEFLEEVVSQLYSAKPLDEEILEHCLEELCHYLGVKLPATELRIQRKEPKNNDQQQQNNNHNRIVLYAKNENTSRLDYQQSRVNE